MKNIIAYICLFMFCSICSGIFGFLIAKGIEIKIRDIIQEVVIEEIHETQ